ncbi:MAG: polysaccharide biosynthesis/export family protein [Crocinitomicaceae bacterium]
MRIFTILILILPVFFSCRTLNSNALFQIPAGEEFVYDSLPLKPKEDYKIGPGDRFSFVFASNNGERFINGVSGFNDGENNNSSARQNNLNDYLVRQDGTAEIPIIGTYPVAGLTIIQFEDSLVKILSKTFKNPFVQIRVTNQRVIIFPGRGQAKVVYLQNVNTTLLEAIALSGGIANDGKAYSIKLMRKKPSGKREIYKIDLSTIHGMREAEMIVQCNDYIYIDYIPKYASTILDRIGPWLGIITTSMAVIAIFR